MLVDRNYLTDSVQDFIPAGGSTSLAAKRNHAETILYERLVPGVGDGPARTIRVRLADDDGERNSANMLVQRMYSWRGYGFDPKSPGKIASETFTASSDGEVIGTLTLTVDSDEGLFIDRTFTEELAPFRAAPGAQLCELTKFAFDPSPNSRPLLAALFHLIYIYGVQKYDCTDLFIEVNPRHVRFYEVMLGFRRIGHVKCNDSVDAPSQLMLLKVADIREYIDLYKGARHSAQHSLYPYFFSVAEEMGLQARIREFANRRHNWNEMSQAKVANG